MTLVLKTGQPHCTFLDSQSTGKRTSASDVGRSDALCNTKALTPVLADGSS